MPASRLGLSSSLDTFQRPPPGTFFFSPPFPVPSSDRLWPRRPGLLSAGGGGGARTRWPHNIRTPIDAIQDAADFDVRNAVAPKAAQGSGPFKLIYSSAPIAARRGEAGPLSQPSCLPGLFCFPLMELLVLLPGRGPARPRLAVMITTHFFSPCCCCSEIQGNTSAGRVAGSRTTFLRRPATR